MSCSCSLSELLTYCGLRHLPIEAVLCVCVCVCAFACVYKYLFMCIFTCLPWRVCDCESGWRGTTPCVMSCEPPSPFLHSYCLRPSYSSKKQKGRYCIRYWLWDGIILCSTMYTGHDALYAAICWRQPAVPSLCVTWSHSVLSFNTVDRLTLISKRCMT